MADSVLVIGSSTNPDKPKQPLLLPISLGDPIRRAQNLRRMRVSHGKTQQDVFDASGMRTIDQYRRLENGVGRPTVQELKNIAKFFGAQLVE